MDDTVILIPVRLQATRFPNKPFAKIGNLPMLHYVYNSAANFFSNVYLAICDQPVEEYCTEHNIQYIMTDIGHVSGSDRIGEAIEILESQQPVEITKYAFVKNSGGPGKNRGGMALERGYKLLEQEAELVMRSDRRSITPYGLNEGLNGTPSWNILYKN